MVFKGYGKVDTYWFVSCSQWHKLILLSEGDGLDLKNFMHNGVLQQHNDPKHTPRLILKWIRQANFEVLVNSYPNPRRIVWIML